MAQFAIKNKCILSAVILIVVSLIFLLSILIGGAVGTVVLNTFSFEQPISEIIRIKTIKFTILGYCIDNKCTSNIVHNFDKGK